MTARFDAGKPKILIATNNADVQAAIRDALRDEAGTFIIASNGDEAIERARDERPNLVLADVGMPERDGYEVCRAIHEVPGLENVPVILLTSGNPTEAASRSFEAGSQDFVAKPFAPPNLRARVRTWLMRTSPPGDGSTARVPSH